MSEEKNFFFFAVIANFISYESSKKSILLLNIKSFFEQLINCKNNYKINYITVNEHQYVS